MMVTSVLLVFLVTVADVYLTIRIDGPGSWLFQVIAGLLVPVALLFWLQSRRILTPQDYGLIPVPRIYNSLELIWLVALIAVGWYLVITPAFAIAERIYPSLSEAYIAKTLIPKDRITRLLAVLYLATVYGCFEEIYYRGITKVIAQRIGGSYWKVSYVIGSSLLFSLIHWGFGFSSVVATFCVGIFASTVLLKLNDLKPLIGAHVAYDVFAYLHNSS